MTYPRLSLRLRFPSLGSAGAAGFAVPFIVFALLAGTGTAFAQTNCATQTDIPELECDALRDIYDTMGGPGWDLYTWFDDQFPCSWSGIICDGGHVTGLYWYETFMNGTFPASIADLTFLESLDFQYDSPDLPPEFFTLPNIKSLRGLHGGADYLQPGLVNFTQLETLVIDGYDAGATEIPAFLGQIGSLKTLIIKSTWMGGTIPPELADLSNLEKLDLAGNGLEGPLPTAFQDLTNLKELNLWFNELTGPLPAEWVFMSSLEDLNLSMNLLSGSLPNGWGNLPNLRILELRDNNLFSFVPPLWSNLDTLEELDLGQNSLTGPIPAAWGGFSSLLTLDLEDNRFTGGVPSNLADSTSPAGRILLLENNHLDGVIPDDWANGSLSALSIGGNCLTTANLDVIDVLDALDPDWFDTQCLPIFQDGFNAGNTNNWDQTVDGLP